MKRSGYFHQPTFFPWSAGHTSTGKFTSHVDTQIGHPSHAPAPLMARRIEAHR